MGIFPLGRYAAGAAVQSRSVMHLKKKKKKKVEKKKRVRKTYMNAKEF